MTKITPNMSDKKVYELLTEFGNDHTVAKGGNILVSIDAYTTSMHPRNTTEAMHFEDTNFLKEQISGAEAFIYWYIRKGKCK